MRKTYLFLLEIGLLALAGCAAPATQVPTTSPPAPTAMSPTAVPVAAVPRTPTIPLPQSVTLSDVGVQVALPSEWNVVRQPGVVLLGPGLDAKNSVERTWIHIGTNRDVPLSIPELSQTMVTGLRDVAHISEFTTARLKVGGYDAAAIWWKQNVPRDPNIPEYWLDLHVPAQSIVHTITFHPVLLSPGGRSLKGMAEAILDSIRFIPTSWAINGLSIEEHALESAPELESMRFVPLDGTQSEILKWREAERRRPSTATPGGQTDTTIGGDKYVADFVQPTVGTKVAVQVSQNDKPIYTIALGESSPLPNLHDLWSYDNHWILEVAHTDRVRNTQNPNEIRHDVRGEIIRDGGSLNTEFKYDEAFGVQLIKGKLFYFFKKQTAPDVFHYGLSYDGKDVDLGYSALPHYGCCSAGALNPRRAESMVAFYAQRQGTWYYVEIGAFS